MAKKLNLFRMFGHSVFSKIALLIAATTVIVASFIMIANKRITDHAVEDGVYSLGQNVTFSVASRSSGAIRFGDQDKLNSDLATVIESSQGRALYGIIVNAEGTVLASHGQMNDAQLADLSQLAMTAVQSGQTEPGGDGRYAAPVLTAKGDTVGSVSILWSSAAARAVVLKEQLWVYAMAALLLVGLCGFAIYVLRKTISTPLANLGLQINQIADGNLREKGLYQDRDDEIGQISRNVENLKNQLAAAKDKESERQVAQEQQKDVVDSLNHALTLMANGDLTHAITTPFSEEYETLRSNFNSTRETIVDIIKSVAENAQRIRAGSQGITKSTGDLAQRTEGQAATLEQTAAAMEELTVSVASAAQGAKDVETVMIDARATAENGGSVVSSAVNAMSNIETSSKKITKILGVIDDISFQTNLLALNAGVEAARAGEAGRGFAVVASEVRALAQRSSDAAQEIKQIITESTEQVEMGVRLVDKTGDELDKIIAQVNSVSEKITAIAAGAEEQATTLGEINSSVSELDQVTQRNAAMVNETTTDSQVLREDASKLVTAVSVFKTARSRDTASPMAETQAGQSPRGHGWEDVQNAARDLPSAASM